jgi:hypothetical protein
MRRPVRVLPAATDRSVTRPDLWSAIIVVSRRALVAGALLALLLAAALAWGSTTAQASGLTATPTGPSAPGLLLTPAGAQAGLDPFSQQGANLIAPTGTFMGLFGYGVALSADGNTALISAPGAQGFAGGAWVFTRSGGAWIQQGEELKGSEQIGGGPGEPCLQENGEPAAECRFARSIALSGDGSTVLIGSPGDNGNVGAAWVFTLQGSNWIQQGKKLTADEEVFQGQFGKSVALSADGNTALIGGPTDKNRGSARVLTRSGSGWTQQRLPAGNVRGTDRFGRSVALSADGNTALVGGPGHAGLVGAAWAFARSASGWTQQGPLLTGANEQGEGRFGFSVALSADGNTALVGGRRDAGSAGAAWAFTRSGTAWTQQGEKLTGTGESPLGQFGYSVALSGDGGTALIGAPNDNARVGAAWEFTRSGSGWTQQGEKLTGGGERRHGAFGASVALPATGAEALIGGPYDNLKVGAIWTFPGSPLPSPPPPAVTRITPSSGPTAGGTQVTIRGSGFLAGASVTVGSAATSVNVLSATEITAVTAATQAGADEVVVTDENGTSSGGPSYTYVAPGSTTNNASGTTGIVDVVLPGSGVLTSKTLVLPPPVLAVTGNLAPVSGTVLVKLPGSSTFVALTTLRQVPFGTLIDATHGKVRITTMGPHGRLQTITLYEGMFILTQGRNGLVQATLAGGDFSVCPTARERAHIARAHSSRASRKHVVRKLWAEGHGSFSTKGNYAAGAVLGTRWVTVDLCGGTLYRVTSDRVVVTNLVNHRHVTVKAGHSYLAKAP